MPVLIALAIEPKNLKKRVSWVLVRGGDCKEFSPPLAEIFSFWARRFFSIPFLGLLLIAICSLVSFLILPFTRGSSVFIHSAGIIKLFFVPEGAFPFLT